MWHTCPLVHVFNFMALCSAKAKTSKAPTSGGNNLTPAELSRGSHGLWSTNQRPCSRDTITYQLFFSAACQPVPAPRCQHLALHKVLCLVARPRATLHNPLPSRPAWLGASPGRLCCFGSVSLSAVCCCLPSQHSLKVHVLSMSRFICTRPTPKDRWLFWRVNSVVEKHVNSVGE